MLERLRSVPNWLFFGVLAALALSAVALPGVLGWFISDWLDSGRIEAILVSYWVAGTLVWLLWHEETGELTILAVLAFVTAAPLIYVLSLTTRAVQVAFGAASFSGAGDFLLRNLDGVLLGAAVGVGLNLLSALRKGTEALGPSGARPDLDEVFRFGLSFRIPLAFLVAGFMDLPSTPTARVILGAAWGIVAAGGAMVYTVAVDAKPIRAAWAHVVIMEVLFLLAGLIAAIDGLLDDREVLEQAVQLVPAAAVACAGTFALGMLTAVVVDSARQGITPAQSGRVPPD